MVGGWVITIDGGDPHRFWVSNPGEGELCVHGLLPPGQRLPQIGEEIWWQAGKIFYQNDELDMIKVGNSHDPHDCRAKGE